MAHCINKKSVDFQTLLEQTNLDESTLSAHIAVWQEDNGLDKWPTPSDLGYATKSIIKPGVSELFESNPELANIGTQEQYSQYLDTIFPDYINNFAYEAVEEFLVANKIIDRKC